MSDAFDGEIRREGERLLVELRQHDYVPPKRRRDAAGRLVEDPFCDNCGFHRMAGVYGSAADRLWVHPDEDPDRNKS